MALHGLAEITLGVPETESTRAFYRDFGLTETSTGIFATRDGGDQLRVTTTPYRQLVEFAVAADNADDVALIRSAATAKGLEVTDYGNGDISVVEPVVGIRARVSVRDRIRLEPFVSPEMNTPGHTARTNERSPAIAGHAAAPRRLGHVLYGTPDLDASIAFLTGVLGFRLSDQSPGIIAFLRCSPDHHNVALAKSPVPFFHHSSWQVNDLDEIGNGGQHLMSRYEDVSVWGVGRHFLGSNLFWYLRDPAGNMAEYYSDLDQIDDDDLWIAKNWEPDKSLYAWGPAVPSDFVFPRDLDNIAAHVARKAEVVS
jgi:catechol 2,3-dioxygenase-like lactoylglutathione lyase family enzyme